MQLPRSLGRDHRPDISGECGGIADDERVHRAFEHLENPLGRVVLQTQQAQRRAALAGAAEGGGDRIVDDLFGQRRRIDHHRIESARFGDQRQDRALARSKAAIEPLRRGRRTGEDDTGERRMGEGDLAERPALHRQHVHCFGWNAGFEQQGAECQRNAWRRFGRFSHYRITGHERSDELTCKDREREVPRTDADDEAAWR